MWGFSHRCTCGSLSFHGLSIASSTTRFNVWWVSGNEVGGGLPLSCCTVAAAGSLEWIFSCSITSERAMSVSVNSISTAPHTAMPDNNHHINFIVCSPHPREAHMCFANKQKKTVTRLLTVSPTLWHVNTLQVVPTSACRVSSVWWSMLRSHCLKIS